MLRITMTLLACCAVATVGCMDSTTQKGSEGKAVYSEPDQNAGFDGSGSSSEGFTTTGSGLQYRIISPGTGRHPSRDDSVLCHYRGTLPDGTEFDSSYKRGQPLEFPLNGVIAAWTEGVPLIGEGGKIELIAPPHIAYGPRGMPPVIPPNATLHFEVELISVQ